eukprot:1086182-Pyramimonas_sp.AAC.1
MDVGGITVVGGAGGISTCSCGHTRMRRGAASAPLLGGAVAAPPRVRPWAATCTTTLWMAPSRPSYGG